MPEFNIFLENTYKDFDIDEAAVHKKIVIMADYIFSCKEIMLKSFLNKYKFDTLSFDIVLADNKEIHRINKEYRKKDAPTDVITFAIFADSIEEERYIIDNEINLGEIIISLDKIKEQSKENNISFEEELYFIISHGILHLLGFDHQNETDYNFMIENQNKAKAMVL